MRNTAQAGGQRCFGAPTCLTQSPPPSPGLTWAVGQAPGRNRHPAAATTSLLLPPPLPSHRVDVGGGKPQDALSLLLLQPPLWAALAGILALSFSAFTAGGVSAPSPLLLVLPPSLDAASSVLAPANRPLLLLAAGMTLPRLDALLATNPAPTGTKGGWNAVSVLRSYTLAPKGANPSCKP